jgi:Tfp pilus assembly protein PilX
MKITKHNNQKRMIKNSFLRKYSREGVVIIIVVVSLITVSLISGTMIKQSMTTEKQSQRESNRVQATWLAESGIERGLYRLKTNKDYTGETWKISDKEAGMRDAGEVLISILDSQNPENGQQIKVTATYPAESIYRVVQTKTIELANGN